MNKSLLLSLAAATFGACTTDTVDRRGSVVRDSAGIRIVEFRVGTPATGGTFRLAREPEIALDAREDDAAFQFFHVVDAVRLPGGGLAVANAGTNEVRIFDARGGHVRTIGRRGDGPGEFRSLRWLTLRGPDSLVVGDDGLRRITIFDASGQVVRTATTIRPSTETSRTAMAAPDILGIFGDGSLLAASYDRPATVAGPIRPLWHLARYAPDATSSNPLASWPGNEFYLVFNGPRLGVYTPPFPRKTRIVVGTNRYWIADDDRWELRSFSPNGTLRTVIRREGGEVPVTEPLLEEVIRQRYEDAPAGPGREQAMARQRHISEHATAPSFNDIRLGTDGRLWASDFVLPGDSTVHWSAVDSTGTLTAYAITPVDIGVLGFGPDYVIVSVKDALERESIQLYRLVAN